MNLGILGKSWENGLLYREIDRGNSFQTWRGMDVAIFDHKKVSQVC